LQNIPGISVNLRYFISYIDKMVVLELFNTRYDFTCQLLLPIEQQPNTPYGLMTSPNIHTNLKWLFAQCQLKNNIYVANQTEILAACMRYVSLQVHDNNVVNYIIFTNQDTFTTPKYSHTYTAQFSPTHLIMNVSSVDRCLEGINMQKLFTFLRTSYKKTGRHFHDIHSIDICIVATDFT
jgi:hypothetical protein